MSGRKGNTFKDAIVLDEDEPEEIDLVVLSDYQPRANVTPNPKVEVKINIPCDDDVRIYGEEFTKSVQSLTGAVARHNKDQRTFQASASPIPSPKGLSACKAGDKNHRNSHDGQKHRHSQASTARMDSPSNGLVPTSWTGSGDCSPRIETYDIQKAIECLPNIATATIMAEREADRRLSVASQLAEKAAKNKPSSGKEPNVKKSGTLAQRMKLPSLPVITDDHGRPMGFAAMLSARDDSRYAAPHTAKDGETRNPADKTSTANGVPKSISPVPPKAIVASSPPCNSVAKPRPKKAPTKNTDTQQPTLNILKSNRKRPLSEMGIHELFTPGQVISKSEWETRKRQRLVKKRHSALEIGNDPKQVQQEARISSVEVETERGKDSDELPGVVEFSDDYDAAESRAIGAVQVQDTNDTTRSEVPEMWNSPLEVPGTTGPRPVNIPENINDQATNLPESCVTEQTSTDKPGPKPDKIYNIQLNSEQEVADLGRLKSIVQGPIESRKPAFDRPKNVRFEEPKPSAKKPALDKQVLPNFEDQPTQSVTIEEPAPRVQEPTPSTRPTTAGKGISEATLAAWRAAEAEDSVDEQEEDLIAVTESTYNYHVHRREWLTEDPESEANAEEQILGPYHTLQEANAVATGEIRHPVQLGTLHSIPSSAWDYSFRQDHDGLQTQVAEAIGVHIEAEVSREPAPPTIRPTFPPSAFKIPSRIYLVQELSWSPTPTPTPTPSPPLCETITHACCTTLTLANKKAAEQWLEAYTGAWSDFHAEGRRKDEVERGLRFDLQEMREGREGFHREVVFEGGGMCKIWVVGCQVEGARN